MALDRFGNIYIDPEGDGGLFNTTQSDLINIIAPTPTPTPTPTPLPTPSSRIPYYHPSPFMVFNNDSRQFNADGFCEIHPGQILLRHGVLLHAASYLS